MYIYTGCTTDYSTFFGVPYKLHCISLYTAHSVCVSVVTEAVRGKRERTARDCWTLPEMNSFSFRPPTFKRSLSRSQELKWCEQKLISLQHLISKLYISAVPVTLIDKHLMTMNILFSWFTFEIDLEKTNRFPFQYYLITFGRWVLIPLRQQTASWYVNPVVIVVIVWSLWPKSIVKQQQKRDYYFEAFHRCSGTTSIPSEIANCCLFCYCRPCENDRTSIDRLLIFLLYLIRPCCRIRDLTDLILCENRII
jgi:hypothetical protein